MWKHILPQTRPCNRKRCVAMSLLNTRFIETNVSCGTKRANWVVILQLVTFPSGSATSQTIGVLDRTGKSLYAVQVAPVKFQCFLVSVALHKNESLDNTAQATTGIEKECKPSTLC